MELNNFTAEGRVVQWNEAIKVYNLEDDKKCVVRTSLSQKYNGPKTPEGYYPDQTVPIVLFGKTAQNFAKTVVPGDYVSITAEFRYKPYTDKEGNTRREPVFEVYKFNKRWDTAKTGANTNTTASASTPQQPPTPPSMPNNVVAGNFGLAQHSTVPTMPSIPGMPQQQAVGYGAGLPNLNFIPTNL